MCPRPLKTGQDYLSLQNGPSAKMDLYQHDFRFAGGPDRRTPELYAAGNQEVCIIYILVPPA